jgi:hypothetical protein
MAKWKIPPTDHDCEDYWVSVSTAAKHCGVPYQYIYGKMQRGVLPTHQEVTTWGTQGKKMTCLKCAEADYGTASSNSSTPGGDLLAEPIQAYRGWKVVGPDRTLLYVDRDPYALQSWHDSTIWAKEGIEAKCSRGRSVPCRTKNHCGFYALNDPEAAVHYWGTEHEDLIVVGAVALWGHYVPGEYGYRAAKGKAVALLCDSWFRADQVHAVAGCYGIPVVHSAKALGETIWGREASQYGDWEGIGTGRSDAVSGAYSGARTPRAACRTAAYGAAEGSITGLKHLVAEGVISSSNVMELFVPELR